ncbi:hypothetical protein HYPSUDRAFT_210058 [Hypholoma sublateritium FD-334 SS-4]|uniref:C2 domain-containing protein n=1 Tax=Hypholoma sublateritium (strain FD-334 SS-4) TaxID=945553 RepID=A0A0D2NWC1_HYPSF|nr:hypothetical protein HYPSUDRAFT_210058 [Hypholoma sublateritium FD-334 SS-4]
MAELGIAVPFINLTIQFIGASGLAKMDVVGSADPYFVAEIDIEISFVYVQLSPRTASELSFSLVCVGQRSRRTPSRWCGTKSGA